MNDGFLLLAHVGELPFRLHDQVQEFRDGVGALADLRVGRRLHDQLEGAGETVDCIGEPEATCALQPRVQGRDGGCRRLSREQSKANGAEREDVELLLDELSVGSLGCQVDVAFIVAGEAERGPRNGIP